MNEDFVSYELAVKLKEKGFNKFCENGYFLKSGIEYSTPNDDRVLVSSIGERIFNTECCWFEEEIEYGRDIIYAPTISQVLKWLREEKNIHIEIWWLTNLTIKNLMGFQFVATPMCKNPQRETDLELYCDYETAAIKGTEYVIDNLI